jgi:hypothetical protein
MTVPYSEAVEGYVDLAKWWLEAAGPPAMTMVDKAQSASMTPDDLVGGLATGVSLAIQAGVLFLNEALDAAAIATTPKGLWVSRTYPIAASNAMRSTRLRAPLQSLDGQVTVPVAAVAVSPRNLHPQKTTITVGFDATTIEPPALMQGVVEVVDVAGAVESVVNVNILV